jgi:hypothetical protein
VSRYALGTAGLGLAALGYATNANWEMVKGKVGTEAADVAQDVLADQHLQAQLELLGRELAVTLLNDVATTEAVVAFVQRILADKQINDSVLVLILRVVEDERTSARVVELLRRVLLQGETKAALIQILDVALTDPTGLAAAVAYVKSVLTDDSTKTMLGELAATQVGTTWPAPLTTAAI